METERRLPALLRTAGLVCTIRLGVLGRLGLAGLRVVAGLLRPELAARSARHELTGRSRDVRGLLLAVLVDHVVLDVLTFAQGAETLGVDGRLVHEKVFAAVGGRDEAVTEDRREGSAYAHAVSVVRGHKPSQERWHACRGKSQGSTDNGKRRGAWAVRKRGRAPGNSAEEEERRVQRLPTLKTHPFWELNHLTVPLAFDMICGMIWVSQVVCV